MVSFSASFHKIFYSRRNAVGKKIYAESKAVTQSRTVGLLKGLGFRIALCASGMTLLLCFWVGTVHAADTPKIDSALCRNQVAYTEAAGVEYKPGVDVHGHYVAPADIDSGASPQMPKKIDIPVTVSLVKALNFDTTQYPFNQLGTGTEAQIGVLSVEGNKVTFNGKPLSSEQQQKIDAACAKMKQ
jgi:hypothetical protein